MKERITNMNDFCAIISGGEYSPLDNIENACYVIACDKGYEYAQKNGIIPDLVVGDFDSYKESIPDDIPLLDLPTEKDDTDTMAAMRYAVKLRYNNIVLYCAAGGRIDHFLGNIQAAMFATQYGVTVKIEDKNNSMCVITNQTITLPPKEGYSLSVLSLSDKCENVSIKGAKYELDDTTLTNKFPIGISNEWIGDVQINVGSGILLIIQSKL